MKTFKTILLTVLALSFSFSLMSAETSKNDSKKKNVAEVTFSVSMNCHSCQAKIEKNIPWEKGVKDLKVDLENKTVKIVYDSRKTSEAALKLAIEKLDFTCEKIEKLPAKD